MINEDFFRVYRNATDFEGRDGRIYSGKRWIVRDADDNRISTFKTRKEAVENVRGNFGQDVTIYFD